MDETKVTSLVSYIQSSKTNFIKILEEIGWYDDPKCNRPIAQKPAYSKFSKMVASVEVHATRSYESMKNSDERKYDLPDSFPLSFLQDPNIAITIDSESKRDLLTRCHDTYNWNNDKYLQSPNSSDEYFTLYNSNDRKALYNYAVQNCTKIESPPELILDDVSICATNRDEFSSEEYQQLEQLKKERDLKRRRQAYRRKISTKNKSQTQIARELIENTMEALGHQTETNETGSLTTVMLDNKFEDISLKKLPEKVMSVAYGYDRYRFHNHYFDHHKSSENIDHDRHSWKYSSDKRNNNSESNDSYRLKKSYDKQSSSRDRRESNHRRESLEENVSKHQRELPSNHQRRFSSNHREEKDYRRKYERRESQHEKERSHHERSRKHEGRKR